MSTVHRRRSLSEYDCLSNAFRYESETVALEPDARFDITIGTGSVEGRVWACTADLLLDALLQQVRRLDGDARSAAWQALTGVPPENVPGVWQLMVLEQNCDRVHCEALPVLWQACLRLSRTAPHPYLTFVLRAARGEAATSPV